MRDNTIKLKRGGLDTIIAYIVVMLPLLYVLIYMVATIYHFSVQMYLNQVVKEATVMASTFGNLTDDHVNYIIDKFNDNNMLDSDENGDKLKVKCYVKEFNDSKGVVENSTPQPYTPGTATSPGSPELKKGYIIGIYAKSTMPSLLGNVTAFSIFGASKSSDLYYSSYREEIIRNDRQYNSPS